LFDGLPDEETSLTADGTHTARAEHDNRKISMDDVFHVTPQKRGRDQELLI
jgi:hypothetical protein